MDWQADVGVDFIKLYQELPPTLVRAGIDEAHRRGIRVIGHLQSTTWTDAARMGIDFIAMPRRGRPNILTLPPGPPTTPACSAASTGWIISI